jgi:hypothetical protein
MSIFRNISARDLFTICALLLAATLPSAHGPSQGHPQPPPGNFLELDGEKITTKNVAQVRSRRAGS